MAEDLRATDYCDGCGCLLREWPPRDAEDALPPGVTHRADRALTGRTARGPYREPVEAARLDVLVEHRQPRFGAGQVASAVSALVLVSVVVGSELPTAMMAGVAALAVGVIAWSLIPRLSVVRFIATPDSLTVVGDGVPLRQGQSFLADDVEGVFVRALARAERQEDRRLELVLLDRHGRSQSLLRGLDDPRALSWIAAHIEWALGVEVGKNESRTQGKSRRGAYRVESGEARVEKRARGKWSGRRGRRGGSARG